MGAVDDERRELQAFLRQWSRRWDEDQESLVCGECGRAVDDGWSHRRDCDLAFVLEEPIDDAKTHKEVLLIDAVNEILDGDQS